MVYENDTIAALSTAPGEAGIAIVRLSGPESLAIADRVFRGAGRKPSERPASTFVHGHVSHSSADAGQPVLDEVVALIYRAPQSYTREDVVEFQGHGGRTCAQRLLQCVLDAGARPAEPGEFTKRAFLNGRIDLMQAEAVADLIRARSERAAAAALEQLDGKLSQSFAALYDQIVDAAALLEVSLDFSEEDDAAADLARQVIPRLDEAMLSSERLLKTWQEGRLLREGARVVIAGQPNAGKSTLLNALLGAERAIVTEIPGTTRDTLEEHLILDGLPIRLVDTAGLRETSCKIEQEGVRRARVEAEQADVVICVIDGSQHIAQEEVAFIRKIGHQRLLPVVNKSDLGLRLDLESPLLSGAIVCSLRDGKGLAEIRIAILDKLHVSQGSVPHAVISTRHRDLIQKSLASLQRARELLGLDPETNAVPAASEIRSAARDIGCSLGTSYTDDVLSTVFSAFCVGK